MDIGPMGALDAVRWPGTALLGEGAVIGGMMVPDEEDRVGGNDARVVGFRPGGELVDGLQRALDGPLGPLARHAPVDEVVEHVHDHQCAVFQVLLHSCTKIRNFSDNPSLPPPFSLSC